MHTQVLNSCAFICTYTPAHYNTCVRTHTSTCVHILTCTYIHIHARAQQHACSRADTHASQYAKSGMHMQKQHKKVCFDHTWVPAHTAVYVRRHTHTYTCMHMLIYILSLYIFLPVKHTVDCVCRYKLTYMPM